MTAAHYSARTALKLRLCYSILTDRPVSRYTWEYYFKIKFNNGRVWVSFNNSRIRVLPACDFVDRKVNN